MKRFQFSNISIYLQHLTPLTMIYCPTIRHMTWASMVQLHLGSHHIFQKKNPITPINSLHFWLYNFCYRLSCRILWLDFYLYYGITSLVLFVSQHLVSYQLHTDDMELYKLNCANEIDSVVKSVEKSILMLGSWMMNNNLQMIVDKTAVMVVASKKKR